MSEHTEYRIEYAIQRCLPGEDDFTEIGFGSSGAWDDLDACVHWTGSGLANGEWETEPGMPDPAQIMSDIQEARHV